MTKFMFKVPQGIIVCEEEYFSIQWPVDQIITLTRVQYGRLNAATCCSLYHSQITCQRNTNCFSTTVENILETLCNNKQSCSALAVNNNLGGDPCPSVYKYLNIEYQCLTPSSTTVTTTTVTVPAITTSTLINSH